MNEDQGRPLALVAVVDVDAVDLREPRCTARVLGLQLVKWEVGTNVDEQKHDERAEEREHDSRDAHPNGSAFRGLELGGLDVGHGSKHRAIPPRSQRRSPQTRQCISPPAPKRTKSSVRGRRD
jgi:hypothetical protein